MTDPISTEERKTPLGQVTALAVVAGLLYMILLSTADDRVMMHVRPRVARARSDMRSLATGLEAYRADYDVYPSAGAARLDAKQREALVAAGGGEFTVIDAGGFYSRANDTATTVSYVSNAFADPFAPRLGIPFWYHRDGRGWILTSPGPDGDYDLLPSRDYDGSAADPFASLLPRTYDPTNGTISDGDLWRVKQ